MFNIIIGRIRHGVKSNKFNILNLMDTKKNNYKIS